MSPQKKTGKEVADYKAALVADAKKTVEQERAGGNYISLKGGRMMLQDEQLPGDKVDAVIVATIHERTLYERPYDPDDDGPPDCFAQGIELADLAPHANVPNPVSSKCKGCPKAEFGTARQGKGPACKTYRKLALIPADSTDYTEAEMVVMRVPPTSVRNYSRYAAKVAASSGMPPWAVKTEISVKPDPKTQFQVLFNPIEPLKDDADLSAVFSRIDAAETMLSTPYTYEDGDEGKAEESTKY